MTQPSTPQTPTAPGVLIPRRRRRVSEARPAWIAQLPAVHALSPLGHLHMSRMFKIQPTPPDAEVLDKELVEWGVRSGLFEGGTVKDVEDSRAGYLVYWQAPTTSRPVLWLMGMYELWVIGVDDFTIERGKLTDELRRACDDVIRHGHSTLPLTPPSRFFLELREKMLAMGGGDLLPQIAMAQDLSFHAWEREQRYLSEDDLPTLAEYLRLRVRCTCIHGPLLTQRCEEGLLPPELHFDDRLHQISDLVNVVQSLHSDILGYRKDVEGDCPMNVLTVISLDLNVDLATAYLMSLEVLEALKHTMDLIVEDVCADSGSHPEAARQARAMAEWMDGFHTWHLNSPRYRTDASAPDPTVEPIASRDWRAGTFLRLVTDHLRGEGALSPALEGQSIGAGGLGTSANLLAHHLSAPAIVKKWLDRHLGWGAAPAADAPKQEAPASKIPAGPTGLGSCSAQVPKPASAPAAPASSEPAASGAPGSMPVHTPGPGDVAAAAWPEIKPRGLGTAAARVTEAASAPNGSAPAPSPDVTVPPMIDAASTGTSNPAASPMGETPAPSPDITKAPWLGPRPTGLGTSAARLGAPPVGLPSQRSPIQ
jgi:hypothetical protein